MTGPHALLAADSFVVARGGRLILSSASVSAESGTVLALCGRNGAGKSTLLNAIVSRAGLVSGRLVLEGQPLHSWSSRDIQRSHLWYWPQRGFLSSGWSLDEHVALLPRFVRVPRPSIREHLRAALAELAVTDDLASKPVHVLSTGERTLAEAAIIILAQPKVLLADECLAGLSPAMAERVGNAMRRLARAGAAVVFTTHQWWAVESFADTVTWVTSGTTRHLGAPMTAREDHAFQREYLARASR
jgi:ABC-type multidrug transport system ATPase subunit